MADIFRGMMMRMLLFCARNMKSLEKLAKMNWIEQNFIFRIIEIRKVIGGVMESCGEKIHFSLESIRNICLISKGFL